MRFITLSISYLAILKPQLTGVITEQWNLKQSSWINDIYYELYAIGNNKNK